MNEHCSRPWGATVLAGIALGCLASCRNVPTEPTYVLKDATYNPYNVPVDPVFEIVATSNGARQPTSVRTKIPKRNIYIREPTEKKKPEPIPDRPVAKISPVLQDWISKRQLNEEVEIIITFREDLKIPLLPKLQPGEDREKGKTLRSEAIDKLREQRARSQAQSLKDLAKFGSFKQTGGFWIVNSVVGKTTIGEVKRLSEAEHVQYIQPVKGGEKPPHDGNPNNDVQDGRDHINSDPFFEQGLTGGRIGLLDTGVSSHRLLSGADIRYFDCVNGGEDCDDNSDPDYNTDDDYNHGTCSAAILTGNTDLGGEYRGVTAIELYSWRVSDAIWGLDHEAVPHAIEAAIEVGTDVLVAQVQAKTSDIDAIAEAADRAFDAGVIVVAANGNYGPGEGTVRSPAVAHKVLGIGAFSTDDGAQYKGQGRGPAPDDRIKPDIQAPTDTETACVRAETSSGKACATGDSALQVFDGTSGATPYAGAAAMLAHNWLDTLGIEDAGQTYALMFLYGQNTNPYDNTGGAGRLKMLTDADRLFWFGKVEISNHHDIDIEIEMGKEFRDLKAALWWPESVEMDHNDIDVYLIDPSGSEMASGESIGSVFERAEVDGPLKEGTWTVRIYGYDVGTDPQTVYWAVTGLGDATVSVP